LSPEPRRFAAGIAGRGMRAVASEDAGPPAIECAPGRPAQPLGDAPRLNSAPIQRLTTLRFSDYFPLRNMNSQRINRVLVVVVNGAAGVRRV